MIPATFTPSEQLAWTTAWTQAYLEASMLKPSATAAKIARERADGAVLALRALRQTEGVGVGAGIEGES